MSDLAMRLHAAIREVAGHYYRLVILAAPAGSGKTVALATVTSEAGHPVVNVNLELTKRMLELTRTQRSRQVERLLKDVLAVPGDVVLLDNLEVLFDPTLEVAPLRLLQTASRNRTVVASWPGTCRDGTLTYAEPEHPEFAQFKTTEAVVVTPAPTGR